MTHVLKGSTRPVHIRRVRAARRVLAPMGQAKSDRRAQVRAICGEWVAPCEAIREDASEEMRLAIVSCQACVRAAERIAAESEAA